jgi:DNA-binding transcriptional MerR regulator/methylmalonyl-CoA mutase cobalamin-binding subunit
VVEPLRTPGGTRRYRAKDLARLQLLKAAVDAGHRIGRIVDLDESELRAISAPAATAVDSSKPLGRILECLDQLNAIEFQRQIAMLSATLGVRRFTREVAFPLSVEIGERWADGRLSIAAEHLATSGMRSVLGAAMQPSTQAVRGPLIVFATPANERHELGLMMAALTAMGAGANPLYIGADLPVEEILQAVSKSKACAVGISVVTLSPANTQSTVAALRGGLPDGIPLFVGGSGAVNVVEAESVERIQSLEDLENRVTLLCEQSS